MTSRHDFRLSQHPDAIEHAETIAELQAADHEQDPYGWLADYAAAREYGHATARLALASLAVLTIAACLVLLLAAAGGATWL